MSYLIIVKDWDKFSAIFEVYFAVLYKNVIEKKLSNQGIDLTNSIHMLSPGIKPENPEVRGGCTTITNHPWLDSQTQTHDVD